MSLRSALLFVVFLSGTVFPQTARPRRAVLGYIAESNADADRLAVFRERLKELGYVEGQNVTIAFRLARQPADYPKIVAELVSRRVDVLLAGNAAAARAARAAPPTLPIVMAAVNDPVGLGVVNSLDHPGTNFTGTTNFVALLQEEHLRLFHDLAPGVRKVAMLINGANRNNATQFERLQRAAERFGIEAQPLTVRTSEDVAHALRSVLTTGVGGLFQAVDNFLNSQRFVMVKFAAQHRLPAIYTDREFVLAGGLIALGPGHLEGYRLAADYVDKILRGAKPAELAVATPTSLTISASRSAFAQLGLPIPDTVGSRVNEWLP